MLVINAYVFYVFLLATILPFLTQVQTLSLLSDHSHIGAEASLDEDIRSTSASLSLSSLSFAPFIVFSHKQNRSPHVLHTHSLYYLFHLCLLLIASIFSLPVLASSLDLNLSILSCTFCFSLSLLPFYLLSLPLALYLYTLLLFSLSI